MALITRRTLLAAGAGPLTLEQLAQKTGLDRRYLRGWLATMVTAQYIEYQPGGKKYVLPPEHAAVVAEEESPTFAGGPMQFLWPVASVTPGLAQAFRTGKGVAQSEFPPEMFEAIARESAVAFKHNLVQKWIPAMPQAEAKLRQGGTALDVGCGYGVASLLLAKAFPKARLWGYDAHSPSIEKARSNAAKAGVEGRVTFEVVDATRLPARRFDLITSFDVLHDSADPAGIVGSVRQALASGGAYLVYEPNLSPNLEENMNLGGRFGYPIMTMYCMTVSLAQGGAGVGPDMNEGLLRQWAAETGFRRVRRLPLAGPGMGLYELGA